MRTHLVLFMMGVVASASLIAQQSATPDWARVEPQILEHFQGLVRLNTSNPPGNEKIAAEYLKNALEKEGVEVQLFMLEPDRPSLVARIKGNGTKRPLLLMGHTDVVTVAVEKWTFPPFSATRDGGYIYGRGTLDDKSHVVAGLVTMLLLKRLNPRLDRDVIFLAESGEEGTSRVGADYLTKQHFADIDAEFCFAEGGGVTRIDGRPKYATVQTLEKLPRPIELTARGTSGHASRPLQDNAVVHLAAAVTALGRWQSPIRLNDTTREYFRRLAEISTGAEAERYRNILVPASAKTAAADEYFRAREPNHAAMLRTSITPTIVAGGYRVNVIPSDAKATIDVRMLPGENEEQFFQMLKKVINDPFVDLTVSKAIDPFPPSRATARLDSEAFKAIEAEVTRHYQVPTLPTMGVGATDMAFMRAKGIECYGMGPAVDREDGIKGFGAHSDQERILESELYRYVRFQWDVVMDLARSK